MKGFRSNRTYVLTLKSTLVGLLCKHDFVRIYNLWPDCRLVPYICIKWWLLSPEKRRLKSLTSIYFVEIYWVGSLCYVIAMTSQRYPTQNNSRYLFTKSDDLYLIDWLLMRESEEFFEVGQIKINRSQRLPQSFK